MKDRYDLIDYKAPLHCTLRAYNDEKGKFNESLDTTDCYNQ